MGGLRYSNLLRPLVRAGGLLLGEKRISFCAPPPRTAVYVWCLTRARIRDCDDVILSVPAQFVQRCFEIAGGLLLNHRTERSFFKSS